MAIGHMKRNRGKRWRRLDSLCIAQQKDKVGDEGVRRGKRFASDQTCLPESKEKSSYLGPSVC